MRYNKKTNTGNNDENDSPKYLIFRVVYTLTILQSEQIYQSAFNKSIILMLAQF